MLAYQDDRWALFLFEMAALGGLKLRGLTWPSSERLSLWGCFAQRRCAGYLQIVHFVSVFADRFIELVIDFAADYLFSSCLAGLHWNWSWVYRRSCLALTSSLPCLSTRSSICVLRVDGMDSAPGLHGKICFSSAYPSTARASSTGPDRRRNRQPASASAWHGRPSGAHVLQ